MRKAAQFSASTSMLFALVLFATALAAGARAGAQTAPVRPTNPNPRPHQEPCWQVAGISKSAMEQRRTIAENTRSEVQSVCADTSLTVAQKHEKIRQIREQAKGQEEALVTPEQMQALHSCQASRGHSTGGVHMGGGGGHGSGPCGELSTNSAPSSGPNKKPQPQQQPATEPEN